jgi:hypothetical protein
LYDADAEEEKEGTIAFSAAQEKKAWVLPEFMFSVISRTTMSP